jgi:DNA polymerase
MSRLVIPGHDHQKPREVSLEEISTLMGDCHLCPLGDTRTTLVFGTGNPHARVMFVGEGPGKNEDKTGIPFVGAAGHKLDALLEIAGIRREDIYIANVVKCRPPGNRNPQPTEIEACSPFLREQIRSIWPDVIVCLGNFAAHFVLHTDVGITQLRGRMHETGHFHVLPVYHPAAAIYDQSKQEVLEADFAMLGEWLKAHPANDAPVEHGDATAGMGAVVRAKGQARRGTEAPDGR